jgi:hypothetical protein
VTKHPVPDKAEVAIDFPEKFYMGSFARDDQFEARADATGLLVKLQKTGADNKKTVELHFHYDLLAAILRDFAGSIGNLPSADTRHRDALAEAAAELVQALSASKSSARPR